MKCLFLFMTVVYSRDSLSLTLSISIMFFISLLQQLSCWCHLTCLLCSLSLALHKSYWHLNNVSNRVLKCKILEKQTTPRQTIFIRWYVLVCITHTHSHFDSYPFACVFHLMLIAYDFFSSLFHYSHISISMYTNTSRTKNKIRTYIVV